MRKFILSALLILCCAANAQQASTSTGHDWSRVQALAVGTSIHVSKLHGGGFNCNVKSVGPDALTCGANLVIDRSDIKSIKQHHRGRSALVAGGAGAGIGFLIGFGVGTSPNGLFGPNFLRGAVAAIGAVIGLIAGLPIGYFTDLTGSTIYQA